MKKRLLSFVLIFALVFGATAVAPTTAQAKKHTPKYYQNKLKKYIKKHGKKDAGEYVYTYTYDNLDISLEYDPMLDEFNFVCFMAMDDDYDSSMYVSLGFERGNNKTADVYANFDMIQGGKECEISGLSKDQKMKKFTFKKIKFGKIKSYVGQKKGKKLLKKLIKPCIPTWSTLLKSIGFSFKKIGFKKLK